MTDRSVRVRLSLDNSPFNRGLLAASANTKAFIRDLESADSRMTNIVQTGLALGPALIPIGAVAVPTVAALATGLGAAALAGGAAVLAFNGVGDSLKALAEYRLAPTEENLAKVREELQKLPASGRDFVLFLDEIRPKLEQLREEAADGMLPGVTEGIDDLLTRLPELRAVVSEISETVGDLFADAGEDLASPRWDETFAYLETDAPQILDTLARAFGNLAAAGGNTLIALDPLADWSAGGLLEFSRELRESTENLGDNPEFQEFIAYIERVGPQVGETLGALAGALVDVLTAAAPVGPVALEGIRLLADVISAIADSDAGPVLIATAAGLSAVSRAIALYNAANGAALFGAIRSLKTDGAAAGAGATAVATGTSKLGSALGTLVKGASGLAGLTLLMSDFDDSLAFENAATFGLLGGAAGPWGAAIGTVTGLLMDAAAAGDDVDEAMGRANLAIENQAVTFDSAVPSIESARDALAAFRDDMEPDNWQGRLGNYFDPGALKNTVEGIFGESDVDEAVAEFEELQEAQEAAVREQERLRQAFSDLGGAFDGKSGIADYTDDVGRLKSISEDAAPVLEHMGLTMADVVTLRSQGGSYGSAWPQFIADFRAARKEMDSMEGRTTSVADAIAGLDSPMMSTAESADALAESMDALFGPELNLSAATDAWTVGLRTLRGDLAKTSKAINGNTREAIKNRRVIDDRVGLMTDVLAAEAAAGAGSQKLANILARQRQALLDTGAAAGMSRKALAGYLNELGLTPKLVRTVLTMAGVSETQNELRNLQFSYNHLPKEVRTAVMALGVDASRADIEALQKKYDLTPAQVQTVLEVLDRASGPIDSVSLKLSQINGTVATTYIDTYMRTFRSTTEMGLSGAYGADGMTLDFYGRGGMRENHVAQIAPAGSWRVWGEPETGGEAYIPFHPSKRARSRDIAEETARRLGGVVEWYAEGGMSADARRAVMGPLVAQFGQRSPIVSAIRDWLSGLKKGELTQRELTRHIRTAIDRQVNPALRDFGINGNRMTAPDVRGEVNDLERVLNQTFGAGTGWLRHVDTLGDRIAAQVARRDKLQRSLDKMTDELQQTRQEARQYRSSVAGSIDNDIFGNGLAGLQLQLRADRNDNQSMLRALRRAENRGLSGGLFRQLAASGDLGTARQVSQMSPREIDRLERLYAARSRAQGALGRFASNELYRDDIQEQTREVREQTREVKQMRRRIEHLERKMERGVRTGARDGVWRGLRDRDRATATRRKGRRR